MQGALFVCSAFEIPRHTALRQCGFKGEWASLAVATVDGRKYEIAERGYCPLSLCMGLLHFGESRMDLWWLSLVIAVFAYDCKTFPLCPFLGELNFIVGANRFGGLYSISRMIMSRRQSPIPMPAIPVTCLLSRRHFASFSLSSVCVNLNSAYVSSPSMNKWAIAMIRHKTRRYESVSY